MIARTLPNRDKKSGPAFDLQMLLAQSYAIRVCWSSPGNTKPLVAPDCSLVGIEEIMMIINHVTEGTVSDHVIGGQNVIRFGYAYLGKVGNVANFVSVHSGVPSQ